ncbi:peptidase C14 [Opitutaceae bacterium TAV5]|nr:peptidase C14 [Opitutaceae bacterium TAV5]
MSRLPSPPPVSPPPSSSVLRAAWLLPVLLSGPLPGAYVVHVPPVHYDHPLRPDEARQLPADDSPPGLPPLPPTLTWSPDDTAAAPSAETDRASSSPSRPPKPAVPSGQSLPWLVCGEPAPLRFARLRKPAPAPPALANVDFPRIIKKTTPAPVPPPVAAPAAKVEARSEPPPPAVMAPLILGDDLRRHALPEDPLFYFRPPFTVIPPPPPLPESKATYRQQ